MFPVNHSWPKLICSALRKGNEDKAETRRGGKTTLDNGQASKFAKSQRAVEDKKRKKRTNERKETCKVIGGAPTVKT